MKIYDVSLPIKNDMLVWPGDAPVSIKVITTLKKDGVRLSDFSFGGHTGTHIDAPNHFLNSRIGIDKIAIEKLVGECKVFEIKTKDSEISLNNIKNLPIRKGDRILFKTGNFKFLKKNKFPKTYVSLSLEGAKFLAQKRISLVGTDFLGIEKRKSLGHPVHKTLLKAGIVILEGLDLENVPAGNYELFCLPLKVVGSDGAPARVILVKE